MHNPFFRFKQFTVHQDRCAMKVGTDSVLLGAWTNVQAVERILDVGSGTGLLSLMLAQRCKAVITGVDVDEAAVVQATENACLSPWKDRLDFIHASFQQQAEKWLRDSAFVPFDLLISNPPFHPEDIKPDSQQRRLARHSDELAIAEILMKGVSLLHHNGRIAMVIPAKIYEQTMADADVAGLQPLRIMAVRPTPSKNIHRYLVEFGKNDVHCDREDLVIEMNERHEYSPEYKALTKDFYLAF